MGSEAVRAGKVVPIVGRDLRTALKGHRMKGTPTSCMDKQLYFRGRRN